MKKLLYSYMEKFLHSDYWIGVFCALGGWVLSFLSPLWPFILLVFVLTMTDLYTGTRAAIARGEVINSRGLRRTVEKITLYTTAILLSEGVRVVLIPWADVTYIAAFSIGLTEFKSNLENISTVTGTDVVTFLKKYLKR